VLGVGDADDDEQDIGQLERERSLRLVGPLGFLAEPVVDLAREFADLLGEPGEVRERREVPFPLTAQAGTSAEEPTRPHLTWRLA
jgi:hypothetical protein